MFIQSCFIKKNTKELKEELKNFGYKFRCRTIIDKEWHSLYCVNGLCFDCNEKPSRYHTIIDCGTNEELFLAIAALRDDIDENQWFIVDVDVYLNLNKGDWFKATDINGQYHVGTKIDPLYCHKASIKELIEHFKDK